MVRDPARAPVELARHAASLDDELAAQGIVGISGIDTRALTRHLRERGAMRVRSSPAVDLDVASAARSRCSPARRWPAPTFAPRSRTAEPYVVDGDRRAPVHRRRARLRHQGDDAAPDGRARHHARTCCPSTSTADEILATGADAVFLSNGPGDPATADAAVADRARTAARARCRSSASASATRSSAARSASAPTSSATATAGSTSRCRTGRTGKVEITAHNHGFAVDAPLDRASETEFGAVEVSHVCLNDNVVEGLRARDAQAFSVQYHPEAAAGPHDAAYLFDRFVELLEKSS